MIPYFQALFIQRHGMISALMIYGPVSKQLRRSAASDQGLHCFPTFFIIFFYLFWPNYLPTIISIVKQAHLQFKRC